ncbi:MAG: cbb3-type cytochrome c oxidase subunit 3 [Burkholderiaceae bacterium]|nr:cbb3-type cytochrome c oxidase subunit 3 [Burkholderiaceae bacterium]
MNTVNFHSVLTLVGVVAFIAMIFWVFGKKQKAEMDRNAMIPLQDDTPPPTEQSKK